MGKDTAATELSVRRHLGQAAGQQPAFWNGRRQFQRLPQRVACLPGVAQAALDAITGMARSHLWHAARAEALRGLGDTGLARDALRQALELAPTVPERRLLARRLAEMPSH